MDFTVTGHCDGHSLSSFEKGLYRFIWARPRVHLLWKSLLEYQQTKESHTTAKWLLEQKKKKKPAWEVSQVPLENLWGAKMEGMPSLHLWMLSVPGSPPKVTEGPMQLSGRMLRVSRVNGQWLLSAIATNKSFMCQCSIWSLECWGQIRWQPPCLLVSFCYAGMASDRNEILDVSLTIYHGGLLQTSVHIGCCQNVTSDHLQRICT